MFNLPKLFFSVAEKHADEAAAFYKLGKNKKEDFLQLTWKELSQRVCKVSSFLQTRNLQKGEHVGILSNTCLDWTVSDIGIMSAGGVTVSLYHTCTPEELIYLINDSEIKCLFLEDKRQLEKIHKIQDQIKLEAVVVFDSKELDEEVKFPTFTFDEILQTIEAPIPSIIEEIDKNETATIVYTSGTSGQLKGVVLTHKNILKQMEAIPHTVPIKEPQKQTLLAFLTSAHIFQRIAGEWYFISQACPVYYCNRIERVGQYLKESQASVILAVPLLMEKIKNKTLAQIQELPEVQKNIVLSALKTAIELKRVEFTAKSKTARFVAHSSHKLLYEGVLKQVKEKISPTLKAVISGGAPISQDTILFFHALGIYLIEGYGLTETTAIMTANSLKKIKLNSVGKPLKDVEVKIAEDDEILVRGDVIFRGYWKKPEATQEAFTEDGWFKTGDIGKLDSEGNLFITGRKKDLIVTAGGKKISPALIEESLKSSPYIEQVAVFGDKQKWLVALITLQREAVLRKFYGAEVDLRGIVWEDVIERPEVKELIESELQSCCPHLAEYEKIRKFKLLAEPFSQANDELTHTMKPKRRVIEKNYAHEIEKLYAS